MKVKQQYSGGIKLDNVEVGACFIFEGDNVEELYLMISVPGIIWGDSKVILMGNTKVVVPIS